MATAQAIFFLLAVILLAVAAFGPSVPVRLDLLGWACAVLAFSLPAISGGL